MTALEMTLLAIAGVWVGICFLCILLAELFAIIEALRNWRDKPDLVVGLSIIVLMCVLTSCAPLRERIFSSHPPDPEFHYLAAWE